jgi:hypothetical protein
MKGKRWDTVYPQLSIAKYCTSRSSKVYSSSLLCPSSSILFYTLPVKCTVTNANQKAEIAVLGMEKAPVGSGTFCPSPMLLLS